MARRRKQARDAETREAADGGAVQGPLIDDLLGALRAVLKSPGVEGIGQPVTILSPHDLPPDLLGFVERLRAGAIEEDEEMMLLAISAPRGRHREESPVMDRFRRALALLCRHALDGGAPAEDVLALLEGAKRDVGAMGPFRSGRPEGDAEPTTGNPGRPAGVG